jgi:hypothetical protein
MKFKLWDNRNREYIEKYYDAAIGCNGVLFDVDRPMQKIEAEVLYSSGVTDRDGTELYVGDVVEALRTDTRFDRGETLMVVFNEKLRCFGLERISRYAKNYIRAFHDVGEKVQPVTREAPHVQGQLTRSKGDTFRKIGDISTDMTAQILFCGEQ